MHRHGLVCQLCIAKWEAARLGIRMVSLQGLAAVQTILADTRYKVCCLDGLRCDGPFEIFMMKWNGAKSLCVSRSEMVSQSDKSIVLEVLD